MTDSPSEAAHETARLSQSSNSAASDDEVARVIAGLLVPTPTMQERKLADILTRLQEDKSRLEGERNTWQRLTLEHKDRADSAESDLSTLRARVAEVLEPFAKFRLEGFDCEVLEVVPSWPENPARRIEPIWASHFRRAADLHASLTGKDRP